MTIFPFFPFTSFSTIAEAVLLFLLVICEVILTESDVPLSSGVDAKRLRLTIDTAIIRAKILLNIID